MKDKHEQLLDSFLASGKKKYILSTYTLLLSARWNLTLNRILFNFFVIPAREGALRFATRSPGESVSTLPFFELRNLTENSVLHQQLKARLTFWRGWGTSDAMPPYISRESPLLSPASHSEILDPRSAPWEFWIFFNVFCLSHNAVGILLLPQNCHLVLRWQKLSGSGGWSPGDVEKWKRKQDNHQGKVREASKTNFW